VAHHPAAGAPEGERGPDDEGEPNLAHRRLGVLHAHRDRAARHAKAGRGHGLPEQLTVLGAADRVVVGADQLEVQPLQGAVLVQGLGQVQGRLAAQRRQQCVGALPLDHLGHGAGQQRLDVRRGGQLRIGHDRGRVGVD